MTVDRIDTLAAFQRLRDAWNTVYARDPEAQFFLSWPWLAGVFEHHPHEWIVLVARNADGGAAGLLPLRLKTVWSKSRRQLRNELHFAGRLFWADYGGILCLPDHEAEVLHAFASQLQAMHWSHLYMKGFRISDRRFALFMDAFADDRLVVESVTSTINKGETDNLVAPYIDLPDSFEAYITDTLSANGRSKTRRFLRKLESSPDYTITTTTADTTTRDLEILERLWLGMWSALKGSDAPRLARTYASIVRRGLADGLVHMPVLWHRETPVGVLASFVDREKSRLLFFVSGRDEAFGELPVGLVLHTLSIRWAIEHGIRTYDLLRGNEPYKYALGAVDTRLRYPLIRTTTGTNLNEAIDPGCLATAVRLALDLASRDRFAEATTACHQVLAVSPGHRLATRLLEELTEPS